ncbi:MAG: GalNAc-alpha-(1-_4)-GalNAc-alpha-(1-_3)-diNAcBac-PP-undecaprenol alpha-1,4-N-acetyl-D-galactosaminyltransferase [Polaribacter sp.]|jgi:GalNAc-alpha-(1->4)-GalNAc-alpha-(1->3)-diNAcBac-PP-undecaprenol alpha-1,4-N-acetyl-D-galactosaminyltransferase
MNSSKKKIAFVIYKLISGGAERVISNLSNSLIEKFEIVIITFEESTPFYFLDERIKVISCIDSIDPPKSIFHSLKLNIILAKRISQILKTEQVNIVLGFITSANILATIAAKMNRIPCIISERNNPSIEDVPKFWVVLRKFVYPLADSVVLQTQGVKKIYEKKLNKNKIIILPNPISSELSELRDDTVEKENLILMVGRLDKNKGQEDLIKAFSSIEVGNWKLVIIGDGYKKQELTTLVNELNLTEKIKIISQVKGIAEYYNKASIFVFISKTEGFPNALLEAMHFGLPCISSDCDFGPSDLIDDGINGYLIPMNQEVILKDRLTQLMNNDKIRNKFANNSKAVTQKYERKDAVARWEELINSLLLL